MDLADAWVPSFNTRFSVEMERRKGGHLHLCMTDAPKMISNRLEMRLLYVRLRAVTMASWPLEMVGLFHDIASIRMG